MHELAVTQNILDISVQHAQDASQITDIHVVIGQLSSFVDEAIQLYWDIISEDTIAVGARLHFHRIAGRVRCQNCQTCYSIDVPGFICPNCGSVRGEIVSGDELYVQSIEVI